MGLLKRTYALPSDTVEAFEKTVHSGKRSSVIATLMGQWLEERERAALARAVVQGCRDMAQEYREIEREYHPLEEEVVRGLDP